VLLDTASIAIPLLLYVACDHSSDLYVDYK